MSNTIEKFGYGVGAITSVGFGADALVKGYCFAEAAKAPDPISRLGKLENSFSLYFGHHLYGRNFPKGLNFAKNYNFTRGFALLMLAFGLVLKLKSGSTENDDSKANISAK